MDFSQLSVEQTLRQLDTPAQGLSHHQAAERLHQHGPNDLKLGSRTSWLKQLLAPFANPFIVTLIIGGLISWFISHRVDATVIALIVIANALVEWGQRASATKVLNSLKEYGSHKVQVRRDDAVQEIDSRELVVGDLVLLREGEKVAADGRLITAADLSVDESSLTGESLPVNKHPAGLSRPNPIYQQTNMIWSGSLILGGRGEVCVTATGQQTQFGKIARLSLQTEEAPPIVRKIRRLTLGLVIAVIGLGGLTFGLGLLRGIAAADMLRFIVALVVSVIPEGLPVTLTIILLLGVQRMAKKQALVRNLQAVETLGMVTTVVTDKTGTLTRSHLGIAEIWSPAGRLTMHDRRHLRLAVSGQHPDLVHPIEKLLTQYGLKQRPPARWQEIADLPFSASRRWSAVLWQNSRNYRLYRKGAPETILADCQLDPPSRQRVETELNRLIASDMRVIAVAYSKLDAAPTDLKTHRYHQMTLVGLIGFQDSLRPEAAAAITATRLAGIKVYLVTGDHQSSAQAVAQAVGITDITAQAITGQQLADARPKLARQILRQNRVFSRVLPEHKFRLLQILKKTEITAMTGDGINDAPALVKADVGIAMGSGTDVAKEAADMVLLDNNYATIVSAIKEGRRLYANVRKMVFFQLSCNLAEALTIVGGLLAGWPLVLTAAQVLWINLVTDTPVIIPLGLEPAEPRQMRTPPRAPNESLLSRGLVSRLVVLIVTMAGFSLLAFWLYLSQGAVIAQTMAFLTLIVVQWATILSSRSEVAYSWQGWRNPNPKLWWGLLISGLLAILAVVGPLQPYLGTRLPASRHLTWLLLPFLGTLLAADLHKHWNRRRYS
ncbi:cation-transporting P-type ATPase [Candidatus Microgenomates bacterium]|nr:cation-transporting P-type ATPase [Candidatus Microgenomates bacterium]